MFQLSPALLDSENNNSLEWHDAWDHSCNDRCPECDVETQPYLSEDLGN